MKFATTLSAEKWDKVKGRIINRFQHRMDVVVGPASVKMNCEPAHAGELRRIVKTS